MTLVKLGGVSYLDPQKKYGIMEPTAEIDQRKSAYREIKIRVLAAFYIIAGTLHFVVPDFYLGIMPSWVPEPRIMVYLSGVAEIMVGIAALIPQLRRAAGVALILVLIAVFPANIQMALQAFEQRRPLWVLLMLTVVRLPLQGVLIWWGWRVLLRKNSV